MRIQMKVPVDAPAERAWDLLGTGFGQVGQWTTAVDGSHLVRPRAEVGAERRCEVSGFGARSGIAVERITAFDSVSRTLSYELVSERPSYRRSARNTMSFEPVGESRCIVRAGGRVELAWWFAPMAPLAKAALRPVTPGARSGLPAGRRARGLAP
jgi:hypothetical protein